MCFWSSLLTDYEKAIWLPCLDFDLQYIISLISFHIALQFFFCYLQNISYSGILCFSLVGLHLFMILFVETCSKFKKKMNED